MNCNDSDIPDDLRVELCNAAEWLDKAISDDPDLGQSIVDTMERYLYDSLWPSNFRELEKALDRLKLGLADVMRKCLINNIDMFLSLYDSFPGTVVGYLKSLQESYFYKYRVGAFRTILSGDGYTWSNVHVAKFKKRDTPWYGISIVRHDGEHLYFEGPEASITQMIGIIQGVMSPKSAVEAEDV